MVLRLLKTTCNLQCRYYVYEHDRTEPHNYSIMQLADVSIKVTESEEQLDETDII